VLCGRVVEGGLVGLVGRDGVGALQRRAVHRLQGRRAARLEHRAVVHAVALLDQLFISIVYSANYEFASSID
jgi:hypothetical protein